MSVNEQDDLTLLYELLEDLPLVDLRVLVAWPQNRDIVPGPGNVAARIDYWPGSAAELVRVLVSEGAPAAAEVVSWSVRIGKNRVELSPHDLKGIDSRFCLLTEQSVLPAAQLGVRDLEDFSKATSTTGARSGQGCPSFGLFVRHRDAE